MNPYLELLAECRREGVRQKNRTGIDTFMIPGGMMKFNLSLGFPILTTKQINFKAVVAELIGFIRGYDHAAKFRELGCKIWDANANNEPRWLENPYRRGTDDLGRIYGVQWRRWSKPVFVPGHAAGHEYVPDEWRIDSLDQLKNSLDLLLSDPSNRRNIVSAWNPADLDKMALPPCHLLYQFIVSQETKKLNLCMYMRSCDMFLGVPFNISSYALLLALVAYCVRMNTGILTMFLADCHIYENHLAQVDEQLSREPKNRPGLLINAPFRPDSMSPIDWMESVKPSEIGLLDYRPHPPIKGEMAV
jgi:thymidylate synthase